MNYVEWCELVLRIMGNAAAESAQIRNYGIDYDSLAQRVWGEQYEVVVDTVNAQDRDDAFYDAIFDLDRELLVVDANATFIKLTRYGRNASKEIFPVWAEACEIGLEPIMQNALKIVNRHSNQPYQYFGRVEWVPTNTVHCELDDEQEDVWELLGHLKARNLVYWEGGEYPEEIRANYRGLTRECRRGEVLGVKLVDRLVAEWETTSVEFKRELHLNTPNQKAEFIKDLMGLANTQASGRRWLIIGFDDKTRAYHAAPDPTLSQDTIEQILAYGTEPKLEVRYEVIPYKSGAVGMLEVLRDPGKVPYKVARSFGRLKENQIFVRHGSQTESPSDDELDALRNEAERYSF